MHDRRMNRGMQAGATRFRFAITMSQRSESVPSSGTPRRPSRFALRPWVLLFAACAAALWFSASRQKSAERSDTAAAPPPAAPAPVAPEPVAPAPAPAVQPPPAARPAAAPPPAAATRPNAETKPQRPPYDPVTEPPLLRGGDGVQVDRTWGNVRDLPKQFGRHGREFKTTSIFRYAAMAAYFFQEAPDRGFPTKIGEDGVIRIYDPGSNTYGEYNSDGTTRTFLRPPNGAEFWAEQPGVEPMSP